MEAKEKYVITVDAERANADSKPFIYDGQDVDSRIYIFDRGIYTKGITVQEDTYIRGGVLLSGYSINNSVIVYSFSIIKTNDANYAKLEAFDEILGSKTFTGPVDFLSGLHVGSFTDEQGFTGGISINMPQGPIGHIGPIGDTGIIGSVGPMGSIGPTGPIGLTGSTGPIGYCGVRGATGSVGPTGPTGYLYNYKTITVDTNFNNHFITNLDSIHFTSNNSITGFTGTSLIFDGSAILTVGITGLTGSNIIGKTGPVGYTGPVGIHGIPGMTGPMGYTGSRGYVGIIGIAGNIGVQGPRGTTGQVGQTGPIGLIGPTGPIGPTGQVGPTGPKGNNVVGQEGLRGWTGQKGVAGKQGPRGQTGPDGPPGINFGPTGPPGPAGITYIGPGIVGAPGPGGPQGQAGLNNILSVSPQIYGRKKWIIANENLPQLPNHAASSGLAIKAGRDITGTITYAWQESANNWWTYNIVNGVIQNPVNFAGSYSFYRNNFTWYYTDNSNLIYNTSTNTSQAIYPASKITASDSVYLYTFTATKISYYYFDLTAYEDLQQTNGTPALSNVKYVLSTDFGAIIIDNHDQQNNADFYLINPYTKSFSLLYNQPVSITNASIYWFDGINIIIATDTPNFTTITRLGTLTSNDINITANIIAFSQDTTYLWVLTDSITVLIYKLYSYTVPIKTLTLASVPTGITYDGMYHHILFNGYTQRF